MLETTLGNGPILLVNTIFGGLMTKVNVTTFQYELFVSNNFIFIIKH